jgi:hypothetical protein
MGGVAAIALVLNPMAPFTKCLFQRFGEGLVLTVLFHPVPGDRMPAHLELVIFFWVTLGAGLGLDGRFFRPGLLMAFMAGDAIHPFLACLLLTQA